MVVEKIKKPNDIKKLKSKYRSLLAKEIRELIISSTNTNGGHLGSNLGDVELIMALHLSFDLPKDKIIYDVGHQSYTHKILTGRANDMTRLRQIDGISGFPSISESDCDAFETGHATTSISAAYGMAKARDILNEDYNVIAVIGDGAMTGGMAYEAINNAASLDSNMIIVLNDNNMSIDQNIGGMSKALADIRLTKSYINAKGEIKRIFNEVPLIGKQMADYISKVKASLKQLVIKGMIFENMGITYVGPVDGHDIDAMTDIFNEAKAFKGCVMIHVVTQKGKGFIGAIQDPNRFHSVSKGFLTNDNVSRNATYSDILSRTLLDEADKNKKIVAITAAMTSGTGLTEFSKKYPNRFFDVGIAEEHAITMAAGMSRMGLHPVIAIYSTFMQRGYDQLVNDLGGMRLPATIILDRAGIVPNDGRTHQGIYDLSYLPSVPNLILLAPKNDKEFENMLRYSLSSDRLIAIRVPKGEAYQGLKEFNNDEFSLTSEIIYDAGDGKEKSCLLIPVGSMMEAALKIRAILLKKGLRCSLINPRILYPIDSSFINKYAQKHIITVSLEENIEHGGFGQRLLYELNKCGFNKKYLNISIENRSYPAGSVNEIKSLLKLNPEDIARKILEQLENDI